MTQSRSRDGGDSPPVCETNLSVSKFGGDLVAETLDWEAIHHDFLYSGMALRRIARKHQTSTATIAKRRDDGGWERVEPMVRLPTRSKARDEGLPPTPTQRRKRIVDRLYELLDAKMSEIERRMAENEGRPQSTAEAEREARNLNSLARLYAKLVELDEAKTAGRKDVKPNKKTKDGADADRLRRDLAGRLARLGPRND